MGFYADIVINFYKYFVPLGLKFLLKIKIINPTGLKNLSGFAIKTFILFLQIFGIVGFIIFKLHRSGIFIANNCTSDKSSSIGSDILYFTPMGFYADIVINFYKYFVPLGLKFLLKIKIINPTGLKNLSGFAIKTFILFLQIFGIVGFIIFKLHRSDMFIANNCTFGKSSSIGATYYISPRWGSMPISL